MLGPSVQLTEWLWGLVRERASDSRLLTLLDLPKTAESTVGIEGGAAKHGTFIHRTQVTGQSQCLFGRLTQIGKPSPPQPGRVARGPRGSMKEQSSHARSV